VPNEAVCALQPETAYACTAPGGGGGALWALKPFSLIFIDPVPRPGGRGPPGVTPLAGNTVLLAPWDKE
jgi:hypothetical protein